MLRWITSLVGAKPHCSTRAAWLHALPQQCDWPRGSPGTTHIALHHHAYLGPAVAVATCSWIPGQQQSTSALVHQLNAA